MPRSRKRRKNGKKKPYKGPGQKSLGGALRRGMAGALLAAALSEQALAPEECSDPPCTTPDEKEDIPPCTSNPEYHEE